MGLMSAFIFAPAGSEYLSMAVILGMAAGHLFDMWAARQPQPRPYHIPSPAKGSGIGNELIHVHLKFLFTAQGSIAKSCGTVTTEQIKCVETLITDLGLDTAGRNQAIAWFNSGKQNPLSAKRAAAECTDQSLSAARMRAFSLKAMCELAALSPCDTALETLLGLTTQLGIPAAKVADTFGQALQHAPKAKPKAKAKAEPRTQSTRSAAQRPAVDQALLQAYQLLGVAPTASAFEVKRAYRRLLSKYHPDKLGPDADDLSHAEAARKVIALRQALELIESL